MFSRAYRAELDPSDVQRTALLRHAGAARFAYNWGFQRKQEVWWMNQLPVPRIKTPSAIDLHRELNARKKRDLGWLYESSKCAPQEALRDLDRAYRHFYEGRGRGSRGSTPAIVASDHSASPGRSPSTTVRSTCPASGE